MVANTSTTAQMAHPKALPTPILVFTCLSLPFSLISIGLFAVNLGSSTIGATTTATLLYFSIYLVVSLASFAYNITILVLARRHCVDLTTGQSCSSSATSITFAFLFTLLWTSGFITTLVRALRTVHDASSGPWQLPIVLLAVESVVMACLTVFSIMGRKKLPDPEKLAALPG